METDLGGAVALVTGASSGIGYATALELARRGADVAVHYLSNEKGARAAAEAVAGLGRAAGVFRADVSRPGEVRALAEAVLARFSRVDVLVNNAGDLVERRPFLEMSEALWRRVLDVNLSSTFFVTQAVARYFFQEVRKGMGVEGKHLRRVRVWEAPGCSATYAE